MRDTLPLLKPIYDLKIIEDSFTELVCEDMDEYTEKMISKYSSSALSNFEVILDEKDERINLLSNQYYMRLQENKYLDFIVKVFETNDNSCIIYTNLFNLNYDYFLGYLNNGIDLKLQYLLLHQYIHFCKTKCNFFCIEDKELLKLFFTFSLREDMIIHFFLFPKYKTCLVASYDCLFPVFYKDALLSEKYSQLAKEAGLYFIKNYILQS